MGDLLAQSEHTNSLVQNGNSLNLISLTHKILSEPILSLIIIFLFLLSLFSYKEKKPIALRISLLNIIFITSYSLLQSSSYWSTALSSVFIEKLTIIFIALNILVTLSLFHSLSRLTISKININLISLEKCSQFLLILIFIILFLPVIKSSSLIILTGFIILFFFFINETIKADNGKFHKNKFFTNFNSISTSILFLGLFIFSSRLNIKSQNILVLPSLIFFYLIFLYYLTKKEINSFSLKLHSLTYIFSSNLILCIYLFLKIPIQKEVLFFYFISIALFQSCFLFHYFLIRKEEEKNWINVFKMEMENAEDRKLKLVGELKESLFKLEVQEMNNEDMMDNLYEQKKAREATLNCLNQGVLCFNKDGFVLEGTTKVAEKLLNRDLFESELLEIKIENILNLSEEKKESFIKLYGDFFKGKINFEHFSDLAPKLFNDSKKKNIFLEYVPYETNAQGNIDRIIVLVTDRTKEIESERAIAEREYELEMSKMELEYMMEHLYEQKHKRDVLIDNLKEGYMTINKEGIIEEGASKTCHDLFETSLVESEIEKIKFSELWKKNNKRREHIEKWIKTIWSGCFQFKDLIALAPNQFDERSDDRYIELEYRPIYDSEDGKQNAKGDLSIKNIIVIASDKTVEKKLLKKIDKDKEEAYFIKTCLQNPEEFLDLINESYSFLIDRPDIETLADNEEFYFRKFHTMKAQYAQFKIRNISNILHLLEEKLEEKSWDIFFEELDHLEKNMNELFSEHRLLIQAANKLLLEQGNSIPSRDVLQHIDKVKSLEELQTLIREKYILKDFKSQFKKFEALIDELAKELEKSVVIEFRGDEVLINTEEYSSFFNTSIHLFRNIMDHGIETKEERKKKNKNENGLILIKTERKKDKVILTIKDDGKGIDPLGVKIKVLEKQLKEPKELDALSNSEIIDFIFLPGFSTRDHIDHISGRGVGTDAVRYEVEKIGGSIKVESEIDVETVFTIVLPIIS